MSVLSSSPIHRTDEHEDVEGEEDVEDDFDTALPSSHYGLHDDTLDGDVHMRTSALLEDLMNPKSSREEAKLRNNIQQPTKPIQSTSTSKSNERKTDTHSISPSGLHFSSKKEESENDDRANEHSFNVSSTSQSTGSSSSLPSTNICCGYCTRRCIMFMRSSINSRTKKILALSSAISLAFVVAIIIYFYFALTSISNTYTDVTQAEDIKNDIELLLTSVLNAETSVRGYVITQNASFLDQYNESVYYNGNDYIWNYFYKIFIQNEDQYIQQYQLPLEQLIEKRITIFNETVAAVQGNDLVLAKTLVSSAGVSLMPIIRSTLSEMSAAQDTRLQRDQDNFDTVLLIVAIIMFIVLSITIVTIFIGFLISYDWDTRLLKRTNNKLELLLKKAEQGTRLKSAFLANISHEIRTPMNGVLGLTQLLATTDLTDDQHDIVDTILQSSEAMMRLINDLLLFSKIEANKFQVVPEWMYLPTFLEPLVDMFTVQAENRDIKFHVLLDKPVPRHLYADSGRLRQVLINLLHNAIKFTPIGHVKLHISMVHRLLSVRDKNPSSSPASSILISPPPPEIANPDQSQISTNQENPSNILSFTPGGTARLTLRSIQPRNDIHLLTSAVLQSGQPHRATTPSESVANISQQTLPEPQRDFVYSLPSLSPVSLPAAASVSGTGSSRFEDKYYIIFTVSDTGIGIPVQSQQHIFEPFAQADMSTTKEFGGTGLGLSISSSLVKAMGGKLKVHSQPGHGSTFDFGLPMNADQMRTARALSQNDDEEGLTRPVDTRRPIGDLVLLPASESSNSRISAERHISNMTTSAMLSSLAMLPPSTAPLNRIEESDDLPSSSHHQHNLTTQHKPNNSLLTHQSVAEASENSLLGHEPLSSQSSRSIKWYDWFEQELYSDADREDQLIMQSQGLSPPVPPAFSSLKPYANCSNIQNAPSVEPSTATSSLTLPDSQSSIALATSDSLVMNKSVHDVGDRFLEPLVSTLARLPTSTVASVSNRRIGRLSAVPAPTAPAPSMRLRLLVVDDNVINQRVAKRLLEKDGHTVILASNGLEAIDAYEKDDIGFDAILMDLLMPVCDGITATQRIRDAETNHAHLTSNKTDLKLEGKQSSHDSRDSSRIPIVAVTASALEEDVERCLSAGFDSVIHKPVTMQILSKQMNKIASKKKERIAHLEGFNSSTTAI